MTGRVAKSNLRLPPLWPEDLRPQIRAALGHGLFAKVVVLEDDPTGTQTVHDVPVLTRWDVELLRREFAGKDRCFHLLTNSRSLPAEQAETLTRELARNLSIAAKPGSFIVVSRSDSTLRGHFPLETDVLSAELGPFDAIFLVPYLESGGRYSIDDTHYVADGDSLVPVSETAFARDAVFAYRSSNLRDYVEEKTGGRVRAQDVVSISLVELRRQGPGALAKKLSSLTSGTMVVVNAAAPGDLDVFVAALQDRALIAKRFLFRTAGQFVAALLGLEPRLIDPAALATFQSGETAAGGLTIVGSHVPLTTAQLEHALAARPGLASFELDVPALLASESQGRHVSSDVARRVNAALQQGRDVVVFTSRPFQPGVDTATTLESGRRISAGLVQVVHGLEVRPRYVVAKGGITSNDIATLGLGVQRAMVRGQLLPGIPIWELGPETRYPGLAYVVFPGNVGGRDALAEAIDRVAQ